MSTLYKIAQANSTRHIEQILALQRVNLKPALTAENIANEGFVTCEHDASLLKKMNHPDGHIIALYDDHVVGYCLVMDSIWRDELDVLKDMFSMIEGQNWMGQQLTSGTYITMGQVCISKDHRKKGLFKKMYQHYKEGLSDKFKYCITEVATSNKRSLSAHAAVGFESLLSYKASDGKEWELILWDWRS